LGARIHGGMTQLLLKGGDGTPSKRILTLEWTKGMLRMLEHMTYEPYIIAESLQDSNFLKLAQQVHSLDENVLVNSSSGAHAVHKFHDYTQMECFIPTQQYVYKQRYHKSRAVATKPSVKLDEDTPDGIGVRSYGTILFASMWAHMVVYGRCMTRNEYKDCFEGVYADMEREDSLHRLDDRTMYNRLMGTPSSTRLNYLDHVFIGEIHAGKYNNRHTHIIS
jgi:hypothetical protein